MKMSRLSLLFLIASVLYLGQRAVASEESMALAQKLAQQLGALEVILVGLFKLMDAGQFDLEMRRDLIRTIQRIAQYMDLMADTLEELIKFPVEEQGLGLKQRASSSLEGIGEQGEKSWLSWLIDVV